VKASIWWMGVKEEKVTSIAIDDDSNKIWNSLFEDLFAVFFNLKRMRMTIPNLHKNNKLKTKWFLSRTINGKLLYFGSKKIRTLDVDKMCGVVWGSGPKYNEKNI